MFAAAQPPQPELRAKCLATDPFDELEREIGRAISPVSPHEAFLSYWQGRSAGDAKARESFDPLVKKGVPLPLSLIQQE